MLKFIIGFERNAAMSRPECHRHLRDVHGPLVKSVPEFTRYVRGYVQNCALDELPEFNRDFVADGAAELWFESPDAFVQAYSEPLYLSGIRPDEANFTNPGRYVASFTHEHTIWQDDVGAGIKLMRFVPAAASVAPGDARSTWEGQHAERLRQHADFRRTVRRYVQNWSIPASDNPFPLAQAFPVVEEFWVADRAAASAMLRIERELLGNQTYSDVLELDAAICLLATEGVII
jgi:EthD domain